MVGTSGFSYKEWKGSFYPEDLPASEMLRFYSARLPTVEINNTFYRMPRAEMLSQWAEQVPDGFRFSLKAAQRITHHKRLRDTADSVDYFFHVGQTLGDRMGPVLFQLPPNFKKDAPLLAEFLATLPPASRCAFEFRHASWFDEEIFNALRRANVALCHAEDEELAAPDVATTGWGYLRLRRQDYGADELKAWAERIRREPWSDVYVFFKHEESGRGAALALDLTRILAS
ncbi:MAG TPA: DUF72 domain-containing protein [Thermoanaerobaculia bacterium]